jgi:hypothetical protein
MKTIRFYSPEDSIKVQDSLENFFGTIRSQGGNCTNPTHQKFENAFKRIFSIDFLEHNESGKCVDDFDKILIIGPLV